MARRLGACVAPLGALLAAVACHQGHACPAFEECVSSQAEADRLNAQSDGCPYAHYCSDGGGSAPPEAGPSDADLLGDGSLHDGPSEGPAPETGAD